MRYLRHVLIALDQLANAVLGGWPDETVSSRAWRNHDKRGWRWVYRVVNAIFFWQDDHCLMSYRSEVVRRQMPPALRGTEWTDRSVA